MDADETAPAKVVSLLQTQLSTWRRVLRQENKGGLGLCVCVWGVGGGWFPFGLKGNHHPQPYTCPPYLAQTPEAPFGIRRRQCHDKMWYGVVMVVGVGWGGLGWASQSGWRERKALRRLHKAGGAWEPQIQKNKRD